MWLYIVFFAMSVLVFCRAKRQGKTKRESGIPRRRYFTWLFFIRVFFSFVMGIGNHELSTEFVVVSDSTWESQWSAFGFKLDE